MGTLVAVLGIFGVMVSDDLLAQITTAITLVVGAAAAVWALVVPLRAAWRVRAQVTPVESPRDVDGTALVRVDGKPPGLTRSALYRTERPHPITSGGGAAVGTLCDHRANGDQGAL
ncbi:hypothetical protein ACFQ46_21375 [Kineococcus sp. GCM10028916]|uniref:hypothetical protein n=1 Tax=Kineococcus sp. GCM10028916 TaxID=3273394 RepID=UPI00363701F0